MPKLFGLHNLYGALAAILVGTLLSLLKVDGLIQLLFVVVAYVGGSIVAHDVMKKRRAAREPERVREEDPEPRFHHFDSRALDQIQEERARSERREAPGQEPSPAPVLPTAAPVAPIAPAVPEASASDDASSEEPAPQHFDSRTMERIERERRESGRRDA